MTEGMSQEAGGWVKCVVCKKVRRPHPTQFKVCLVCADTGGEDRVRTVEASTPTTRMSRSSASREETRRSVAKWRQGAGADYQKQYNKAVRSADKRLRERYPDEWAMFMEQARTEEGLV